MNRSADLRPPLTLFFDAVHADDTSADDTSIVGGKGANLGALTHAGVQVPPGFCVITRAYELFIAQLPDSETGFAELDKLDGTNVEAARRAAETMRAALEKPHVAYVFTPEFGPPPANAPAPQPGQRGPRGPIVASWLIAIRH